MAGVKGRSGAQNGVPNNKSGRPVGAKNVVTYDVKKKLSQCVDETFMTKMFEEIELIESYSERVKARIKIIDYFVPKPKDTDDVEAENEFRKEFMNRLFPK